SCLGVSDGRFESGQDSPQRASVCRTEARNGLPGRQVFGAWRAATGFGSWLALRPSKLGIVADVTQILNAIEQGDPHAAADLLPLVYDELRKLAAARLAAERPGQTLQATALVHEVYVRFVRPADAPKWDGRGHFFAAAAAAMRRTLVENGRRKGRPKPGGGLPRGGGERATTS